MTVIVKPEHFSCATEWGTIYDILVNKRTHISYPTLHTDDSQHMLLTWASREYSASTDVYAQGRYTFDLYSGICSIARTTANTGKTTAVARRIKRFGVGLKTTVHGEKLQGSMLTAGKRSYSLDRIEDFNLIMPDHIYEKYTAHFAPPKIFVSI